MSSYLKNKDLKTILKIFKDDNSRNIGSLRRREELVRMYKDRIGDMVNSVIQKNRTEKNLLKGGILLDSMEKMRIGGGLFDRLKSFLSNAKKLFKPAANLYRGTMCDGKARSLEDGEYHWKCHNFTGPGTVLTDKTRNVKPYNDIDNCSKIHDLEYERINNSKMSKEEKSLAVQKADQDAIDCYDKYPSEDGYLPAKAGIKGKLSVDQLLSSVLGKPSTVYGGMVDEIVNIKTEVDNKKKRKKITKTRTSVRFEDIENREEKSLLSQLEQADVIQKLRDLGYLISPDRRNNNFKFRLKGKSRGTSTKMNPYLSDDQTVNRENMIIAASQLIEKEGLQL